MEIENKFENHYMDAHEGSGACVLVDVSAQGLQFVKEMFIWP